MVLKRVLPLLVLFPAATLFAAETDDARKLEGVWKGWVVEGKGDKESQRRMKIELTIKGNTVSAVEDGKKDLGEGTFTLKATADGKVMDATRVKGMGSRPGATYLGIYLLEGDTLKWCVGNPPGKTRPAELQTRTGQFLMILTKDK